MFAQRSPSAVLLSWHCLLSVWLSISIAIFTSKIAQWKWRLATHNILLFWIKPLQTQRHLVTTSYSHRGFLSVAGSCLYGDIKAALAAHREKKTANTAWSIARGHPIKCVKMHVPVWWGGVQGDTPERADTWTEGVLWSQLLWGLLTGRNAGMVSKSWCCSALLQKFFFSLWPRFPSPCLLPLPVAMKNLSHLQTFRNMILRY